MTAHPLAWGRHYAMVDPASFRIDYVINPFMDPAVQPDPGRARDQWEALQAALVGAGAVIDVIPALPGAPDMVYAMNLGLVVRPDDTTSAPTVLLSRMRHVQRRLESTAARAWFEARGYVAATVDGVADDTCFEAGDAFPFAGELVVGFGPRTDGRALAALGRGLGVGVRGVEIVDPSMYHLDLAFCPLDDTHALVCPDAFTAGSARAVLDLVPSPVVVSRDEAINGLVANSVVVDGTIVMPSCPQRLRARLEGLGLEVVVVDVSEFHLGGGSVRCLTNPLDITIGRDLVAVAGGRGVPPDAAAA